MSHNPTTPRRTRPDLGKPTAGRRSRRDPRGATPEGPDALLAGISGWRPDPGPEEASELPVEPPGWFGFVVAGGAAALCGWVVVVALATAAWLTFPVGGYAAVVPVATQWWLAGHGASFVADGTRWTLVPFTLTALLVWLTRLIASAAVHRLTAAGVGPGGTAGRAGLFVGAYAAVTGTVGVLAGAPGQGWRGLAGGLVVAALALWWAQARTRERRGGAGIPRGVLAGVLTLVAVGAGTLAAGLVLHRGQLVVLTEDLGGGPAGMVAALFAQVLYLPTLVWWAACYTLGARIGLGDTSVVSLAETRLGLLPGWPVLAGVPTEGPGSSADLVWLAGGVVAGMVAATVALRASRWHRPDTASAVGGGVGLLTALTVTGLSLVTRGGLGTQRLAAMGAEPLDVLVLAGTTLTCGGLLAGLVIGLVRWGRWRRSHRPQGVPPDVDPAVAG